MLYLMKRNAEEGFSCALKACCLISSSRGWIMASSKVMIVR